MSNIQIGIDLGTTNSEIAIYNKGQIEVLKNTLGDQYTPSVFGVNKAGDEEVGKKPYNRYFKDCTKAETENNKPEIKRLMGTSQKVYFSRIDKEYLPEEISAKILESLKQDAIRKNPDINTYAAVITIPAYFSTVQAEATKRAGEIAGFKYVVLLQEPIAAAMSYGFGNEENENWLVYDLGGGTFDSALISSKEGNLKVLNHGGDNFLGGKDIDNIIIDKKITPVLTEKYNFSNFSRSNDNYKVAFAKLKHSAEQAKIQLSSMEEVNIEVDLTINDEEIYENIPLSISELETLVNPLMKKTIDICQKTITDAHIENSAVDKIILVGGPTQLPFIKKQLEKNLSIKVDTSSDPLTAVANGACIFACGQRIPDEAKEEKVYDDNTYSVDLFYESLTSDDSEMVTGEVKDIDNEKDYFVQIQNENNSYNSGKIRLKNGKFVIEVPIEKSKINQFWLYLFNADGEELKTTTEEFSIQHGLSVSGAPIPHTIGVGITTKDIATGTLKQEFEPFFDKNSYLPLERTKTFRALKSIRKGDSDNALPIAVYEGEELIPDRNFKVCDLAITGNDIPFDISQGDDIEVTIRISESRELTVEAYIPVFEKSFNARATVFEDKISIEQLTKELDAEIERSKDLDDVCDYDESSDISDQIRDIRQSIKYSENDEDEKSKTAIKLRKLKADIDKLKSSKNTDVLVQDYYDLINRISESIDICKGSEKERFEKRYEALQKDGDRAVSDKNTVMLSRINSQLRTLYIDILSSDDSYWKYWIIELAKRDNYVNMARADYYIEKGLEALNQGNISEVKNCVRALWELSPYDEDKTSIAGITR